MQRITPMVDDSGAVYEVGDADRPRFDELMKGRAQQRHTFRGKDGQTYDVPEADRERFQSLVPDAEEIHRFQMDDGGTMEVRDSDLVMERWRLPSGMEVGIPGSGREKLKKGFPDAQLVSSSRYEDSTDVGDDQHMSRQEWNEHLTNSFYKKDEQGEAQGEKILPPATRRVRAPGSQEYKYPQDPSVEALEKQKRDVAMWREAGGEDVFSGVFRGMFTNEGLREIAEEYPSARPLAYVNDLANSLVGGLLEGNTKISEATGRLIGDNAVGRAIVNDAKAGQEAIHRNLPTDTLDTSGGGVVNTVLQTGKGVAHMTGEFAPAAIPGVGAVYAPAVVSAGSVNRYAEVHDAAVQNGMSEAQATGLATGAASVDALQNLLLMRGFKGIWSGATKTAADETKKGFVRRALGFALDMAKTGAIMSGGGMAQDVVNQNVGIDEKGNVGKVAPYDFKRTAEIGVKDFFEGGLFHAVNAGAHGFPKAIRWSEIRAENKSREIAFVSEQQRAILDTPEGRALVMMNSPDAARALLEARQGGKDVSRKMLKDLGIIDAVAPSKADRNALGDAIVEDYKAYKEVMRRTPDEQQSAALDAEIKALGADETAAGVIRESVLGKIEDAKELDDPQRRAELVYDATQEAFGEFNKDARRENNERIRAEKRQRKADEAAERERAEREAREAAEEQERAIQQRAEEEARPRIQVEKPEAEAAPADRLTEYPEYAEWLRKNGKADIDKNWNKFVAQNEMDPALKVVRDKKGNPVKPEPPAPAKPEAADETKPVADETKPPVVETKEPVAETKPPVVETKDEKKPTKTEPEPAPEPPADVKPPAEDAKNGPVSAPKEEGTITPAKPAEAPRAAEPKPGEPPKVAETATGAKDPVVDETGSAAEVVPPDSVEARISAMKRGSPEQLKAQREYFEKEIAKARAAIDGKFEKLDNYGGRGRVKWLPKDEADELPPTVTVKVPGDGEFTVKNTPEGMDFLDKIAAKFKPQKSGKAAEVSAPSVPRPPTVTVAKKPKEEPAHKEMEPFVSTDRTRASLMKPMSDGEYVYATNGKIAIRRPLRKGEKVKGADEAPIENVRSFFDNKDPDHKFKANVSELYSKLVQADAVTGDGDDKGWVELWHDGSGKLHIRARDGAGNSYATDAGSDYVSKPLTVVNGQYLRDFLRLAAKHGAGEVEIGVIKKAIGTENSADFVTLKGGEIDGLLVSITNADGVFKNRAENDARLETARMMSYGEKAWVASLSKKLKEERDGLVATATQGGTAIDPKLKAEIEAAKDALAKFDEKHGKSEFVSEFVKNGGNAPAKPKKGNGGADGKLGSPDAASPLRPAKNGDGSEQGELELATNQNASSRPSLNPPATRAELRSNIERAIVVDGKSGKRVAKAHEAVPLSDLPQKLREVGVPDGTLYTRVHNIRKMKKKHGIDVDGIVGLVDDCSNPVAVMRDTNGNNFIVLTDRLAKDLDGREAPVMVYLEPDAQGNYIVSAYSRTMAGEEQYRHLINAGKLLYVDKERVATLPLRGEVKSSFESFSDGDLSSKGPEAPKDGNRISQSGEPVNGDTEKTSDDHTIDRTETPTKENPLGQVVAPKEGSVAQAIDAEIAADDALAAKGKDKPQGVPPAPAPGSAGNAWLDPGYEPESIGAGVKNPVARQQIVDKFKELFGDTVAIRGKNTTPIGKSFSGHYEPNAGVIRSKDPVSLRTIPHEIGHHIDALLKRQGLARPANVRSELIALGRKLYGPKKPNGGYEAEGYAELIKYYLQGNDAGLKKEAPAAYDWLTNKFGKANPDTMARLDAMRDMIDRLQNQSGEEAVRAIRAKNPSLAERVVNGIGRMVQAVKPTQENWLDTGAFITKGMRASGLRRLFDWQGALKRGDVAAMNDIIENHPVLKWKLYNGKAGARAYRALEKGLTDLSGTRRYTYGDLGIATPGHAANEALPTFREIFGDFTAREMDAFQDYAIARIAKEAYLDKGLEFGLTTKEVEPVIRKYANNAKFRDALERYTHYKHGVLHLLVDAGAMSQAQFEAIVAANPIYVKIARRRESTDFFKDKMLKRQGKAVNRRTGSGRQVEDIFDAGLIDDERVFAAAFQADLLRSLVNAGKRGERAGGVEAGFTTGANWLREVPNAQGEVKFTAEKLRKQITDAMQNAGQATDKATANTLFDALFDDGKDTLSIFKEKPSNGKNGLVSLYDQEGKLHTYELPENNAEGWAKGLMGFTDATKPNLLEQWAQIAAAATRSGATTLNPVFALRNIVKDTLHAATVNEFGAYIPGASTVQGIAMDMMDTNAAEIFKNMGIPMGSMLGESRLQSAHKANKYLMSKNWFVAQWNKGVKKAIADFVGFSENGSRIKEFKLARDYMLKHGASEKAADMIAGCNALDITVDFQRGGEASKAINRFIPFFNAGIQGIEQAARSLGLLRAKEWQLEQNRGKRAARTVLHGAAWLTSLALAAELYNRSDDERKKKADELKPHEKWNYISLGDVRLPVPYEIGYVFASIPRAVAAELYDGQDGAVAECLNMFHKTMPGLSPRDMALIGPALNVAMNESWTGSAIVPDHVMRGKRSYDWYDDRTTEFSKHLAKAFHGIFGDSKVASPAHLDSFLNGVTGNMYGRILGTIEGESGFDEKRPYTWPVIGTFFRNNATASRVVSEFYERKEDLTRMKGSSEASDVELAELKSANKVAKTLSDLRKAAETVRADTTLSTTERNDRLERISLKTQEICRNWSAWWREHRSAKHSTSPQP